MTRKLHPNLPPRLESKVRGYLEPLGAEDGGVYVYISKRDAQKSTTPELTDEDKVTIRRMFKSKKASAAELASLYGKTRQTIYKVIREEPDE